MSQSRAGRGFSGSPGFTLVELLVVVGIIAVLIGILLPSLNRARAAASTLACKSMLRQYWAAGQMYQQENNGVSVDAYKYLDHGAGLAKYLGQKEMTAKITRCPADNDVRVGVLGGYTDPADPSRDYKIRRADGSAYTVAVSYGMNPTTLSQSLRLTNAGVLAPRWVKPLKMRREGWDPSKAMIWSDWQNNPEDPAPSLNVVKPYAKDHMGTIAFRHSKRSNAVFADGHVGSFTTPLPLTKSGLDLAPGAVWTSSDNNFKHMQLYYPFGPGFEGSRVMMRGDLDTLKIE